MAFNRDWLEGNPIDHLKFKSISGEVREFKVDVSDRLKTILSGFITGETIVGIKLGKYLTTGTAAPTAPSGTGTSLDMNLYVRTDGTGTYGDFYIRNTTGGEIRLTLLDKLCLNNARISNDTWLTGNNTNSAAQNIFKINTANAIEFSSIPVLPASDPTTDNQASRMKFVVDQVATKANANPLGAWVNKTADYGAQQAATDGFVIVDCNVNSGKYVTFYTDGNANPTTARETLYQSGATNVRAPLMCPVKKNDYWKVVIEAGSEISSVYWIPLGS